MIVNIKLTHPNAVVPEYQTPGSAGFDLSNVEDVTLEWNIPQLVDTGLVIETPRNHVLMLVPRSSTFKKWGVSLANTVGIIDSDYCGNEDKIYLNLIFNKHSFHAAHAFGPITIPAGTRLAQGLFLPVQQAEFQVVENMNEQSRGGFGSTG